MSSLLAKYSSNISLFFSFRRFIEDNSLFFTPRSSPQLTFPAFPQLTFPLNRYIIINHACVTVLVSPCACENYHACVRAPTVFA